MKPSVGSLEEAAEVAIRPVKREDTAALMSVIEATGLFPPSMLKEMLDAHFDNPDDEGAWLLVENGAPHGVAYYAPERMTSGTWNLYLIAVHPTYQRQGLGGALMRYVEDRLASQGERILLVETSGLQTFEATRAFYRKCGYDQEATIRDFYQAGEDKIVFRKALTAPGKELST